MAQLRIGNVQACANITLSASVDSNLIPSNIKSGVTIFGVTGTYTGSVSLTVSLSGSDTSNLDTLVIDGNTYSYSDFTNDQLVLTVDRNKTISWSVATTDDINSDGTISLSDDGTMTIDITESEGTSVITVNGQGNQSEPDPGRIPIVVVDNDNIPDNEYEL